MSQNYKEIRLVFDRKITGSLKNWTKKWQRQWQRFRFKEFFA